MNSKNPKYVPKGWALPESIVRRLGDEIGRQRLMDEDGHLLVLLHTPPKSEHNEERHPAVFWRKPDGEWKSAPESGGLLALKALLSAYMDMATELDHQAETASAPRQFFRVIRELAPLHRSSRHLLEVMEELRKARPEERELILLRDEAVNVERAADMALVDARAGMDFVIAEAGQLQAQMAQQSAVEAQRLNRLAALFLPMATLAAIFGINRPEDILRMPGLAALVGAGLVLGLFARLLIGRKPGG